MDVGLDPRIVGALGLMVLLTIAPGPDMALVISTSLARGRRAAFRTALGISTGTLIWATLAGIGVAAILEASAEAFTVVRLLGAAYLVYLRIRALVEAFRGGASPLDREHAGGRRSRSAVPPGTVHEPAEPEGRALLHDARAAARGPR